MILTVLLIHSHFNNALLVILKILQIRDFIKAIPLVKLVTMSRIYVIVIAMTTTLYVRGHELTDNGRFILGHHALKTCHIA